MSTDVEELVQAYQRGATGAEDQLFGYLYPRVRQKTHRIFFLKNCTKDPTDILHDALLKLKRKTGLCFHNFGALEAFAVRMVRDCMVAYIRNRQVRQKVHEEAGPFLYVAQDQDKAKAMLNLYAALTELEADQPMTAHVLRLKYFSKKKAADICKELNISDYRYRQELEGGKAWLKGRL